MPELQLTLKDRQFLNHMDAAFQPQQAREEHASCQKIIEGLGKAYRRLDNECAQMHRERTQAERERAQRDRESRRLRHQRNALAGVICIVGPAAGALWLGKLIFTRLFQ